MLAELVECSVVMLMRDEEAVEDCVRVVCVVAVV